MVSRWERVDRYGRGCGVLQASAKGLRRASAPRAKQRPPAPQHTHTQSAQHHSANTRVACAHSTRAHVASLALIPRRCVNECMNKCVTQSTVRSAAQCNKYTHTYTTQSHTRHVSPQVAQSVWWPCDGRWPVWLVRLRLACTLLTRLAPASGSDGRRRAPRSRSRTPTTRTLRSSSTGGRSSPGEIQAPEFRRRFPDRLSEEKNLGIEAGWETVGQHRLSLYTQIPCTSPALSASADDRNLLCEGKLSDPALARTSVPAESTPLDAENGLHGPRLPVVADLLVRRHGTRRTTGSRSMNSMRQQRYRRAHLAVTACVQFLSCVPVDDKKLERPLFWSCTSPSS